MSQVKDSTIQVGFGGGMNFRDKPDELRDDEAQLIRNMRIRKKLKPSKAGVDKTRYEVPILLYERFVHDVDNPGHILRVGTSHVVTPDHIRGDMFITNTFGFDIEGIVSQHLPTIRPGSFIQIRLKVSSNSATFARISLQRKKDALEANTGLELEFAIDGNLHALEDGAATDTGFAYSADTEMAIKFEKQADDGWKIFKDGTLIYTTTFTGEVQNYLAVNVYNVDVNIFEILYHRGLR